MIFAFNEDPQNGARADEAATPIQIGEILRWRREDREAEAPAKEKISSWRHSSMRL